MSEKSPQKELLNAIFSSGGLLSRSLNDFEDRKEQKEMAEQILKAYEEDRIALIEAATGTGKSLAYLFPAILWAVKHQEKTIISTHTIALQEQLIHKDIPLLIQALDLEIKATLVKGMGNYLCLRKLEEWQEDIFETEDKNSEMLRVMQWSMSTKEGSRSDLSFPLSSATWEKVCAEKDACSHVHCPHYKRCFFFKARKQIEESQILVINHHVLFADVRARLRKEEHVEKSLLSICRRLILDEAHHLEEAALSSLCKRVDRLHLLKLLSKISPETFIEKSSLEDIFSEMPQKEAASLKHLMEVTIPAEKRELSREVELAFDALEHFFNAHFYRQERGKSRDQKLRLPGKMFRDENFVNTIACTFQALCISIEGFTSLLLQLKKELENLKLEKMQRYLIEIQTLIVRLEENTENLKDFFSEEEQVSRVRFIEKSPSYPQDNVSLVDTNLDVSSHLHQELFSKLSSVVLCSATLATNRQFAFIKERLGLLKQGKEQRVIEGIWDSPFDFANRTLLVVPTDIANPLDPDFPHQAAQRIYNAIEASQGSAFVLFTSYEMLSFCFEKISALSMDSFPKKLFLKQGDASRQSLIETFRAKEGSVLFATDSFWEGVDVAGEALRAVIIVKLPFKVPSDPVTVAQAEALQKEGKDPFLEFALPQAIVKFKQGFGRLMRKKSDRGCIVCLDKRLITKGYGKFFLNSLPQCQTRFDSSEKIFDEMKIFYRRTRGIGA